MDRKENYISVIGAHYVPDIVLGFLPKIFDAYKVRDYKSKNFQVSTYENTFSTAGVLLTVVSIESYGNRILQLEGKNESLLKTLPAIFSDKRKDFPGEDFKALLHEVYVLRDVIAHNHIYSISATVDADSWDIKDLDEELVIGKGPKDFKYKAQVDSEIKKSKLLQLHVQPLKIGFEELFTVLIVFDLLIRLAQSLLSYSDTPFQLNHKIGKSVETSLSRLLAFYYRQISNEVYLVSLGSLLKKLRSTYASFLASPYDDDDDAFVKNICPRPNCGVIGFHSINRENKCKVCGLSIGLTSVP